MPARKIEISCSEIARWSEPLIADFIYSAYEHCLGGRTQASEALGSRHCRLWRNLLNEEPTVAAYLRRELLKAAAEEKVPTSTVDAIDAAVLDSLLDVLMRPGLRSRDSARNDGLSLVHAASTLGEIRKVA